MTTLETIGAVVGTATAAVALIGALGAALVKAGRVMRRFGRFLDDWFGHDDPDGRVPGVLERVDRLDKRTRQIELQVFPNGGSSLRDAVTRLEIGFADHLAIIPPAVERIERKLDEGATDG